MSLEARETRPTASVEDVLKEAERIWGRIRASGVAADDAAGNDALLEELQAEFGNFGRSFPVVLRWMVQLRKYSRRALEVFLLKHATLPLATEEDFLALQAEYPVQYYAYDKKGGRGSRAQKKVGEYRAALIRDLKAERERFKAAEAEAEKVEAARRARVLELRRADLLRHLLARRELEKGGGGDSADGEP